MDEGISSRFYVKPAGGGGDGGGVAGKGSMSSKCGRWNPTAEQVKVLTELFRSGLRTPSSDQIQKISHQLSFYGKIESKNVFYWFQNHKARERQKRRKVSISLDHTHRHHQQQQQQQHFILPPCSNCMFLVSHFLLSISVSKITQKFPIFCQSESDITTKKDYIRRQRF